jgi:magnesium transporter
MAKKKRMPRGRRRVAAARRTLAPGSAPGTLAIDPEAPPPKIRVFAFGPQGHEERAVDRVEDVDAYLEEWPVTWINVDGLGSAEVLKSLAARFSIHRLALEDVVNTDQRAKVEEYDENLFVVFRMLVPGERSDDLRTEQISFLLGPGYVLSFQERRGDYFEAVRERIRAGNKRITTSGPDYLLYALLDALIDAYFPIVEGSGQRIDALEEGIQRGQSKGAAEEIQRIKRELLVMRRAAWPQRDALRVLQQELGLVQQRTAVYFRDCSDHAAQIIDLVESYRESCSDLMNLHVSNISNRMNEVMKVLTIIATIFIPLGFIAGIYGMNFNPERSAWNMPELDWVWGYPFALGLMVIVASGLLVYFRKKGWF